MANPYSSVSFTLISMITGKRVLFGLRLFIKIMKCAQFTEVWVELALK